jgi:hypothetical protein
MRSTSDLGLDALTATDSGAGTAVAVMGAMVVGAAAVGRVYLQKVWVVSWDGEGDGCVVGPRRERMVPDRMAPDEISGLMFTLGNIMDGHEKTRAREHWAMRKAIENLPEEYCSRVAPEPVPEIDRKTMREAVDELCRNLEKRFAAAR